MGIFTVIFKDDDAWVIFDRCRRVYVSSAQGGDQTWATYKQAADVCADLNRNHGPCVNGIGPWIDEQSSSAVALDDKLTTRGKTIWRARL